jgi:ATP-dependent Clp protease adaptor protein ClpS
MYFVIEVLMKFFNKDSEIAPDLMLKVHHNGKAICGVYSADVAHTKAEQVNRYARDNEHPLLCSCEQE